MRNLPNHLSALWRSKTLQGKFTIGFVFIFTISACSLYFYVQHTLKQQMTTSITADMRTLQSYAYNYFQQYNLLHPPLTEEQEQDQHLDVLLRNITLNSGHHAAFYDDQGSFFGEARLSEGGFVLLEKQPSALLQHSAFADLAAAGDRRSIVTIRHTEDRSLVFLTFPVYVSGELLGMLRLSTDYTDRYQQNAGILRSITLFSLVLFLLVFLFSFFLTRRLTTPLSMLSQALLRFGNGQAIGNLPPAGKDEIGEITRSFEDMRSRIDQHMQTILGEKHKIAELERSRTEFYHQVTHELKTPLTTISGYAQIIGAADFQDPVFLQKASGRIHSESRRLHRMVVEMIELSKQERIAQSAKPVPIDLTASLQAAVDDLALKAATYDMQIHCRLEQMAYEGYPEELRKLWINILDNAIKYGRKGSNIELAMTSRSDGILIELSNQTNGGSKADPTAVFEPFYRRKDESSIEQGSVGLGLFICRQVVQLHQGRITFSEEDQRVTIRIELPQRT